MIPRALLRWSPILALLAGIAACNGILDIEERAFDPDLSAAADPACADYCAAAMDACQGDLAVYASLESCPGTCRRLPKGKPGDQSGNTVECRLERAKLALATGEASSCCPSAGPGGEGTCGTNCEGFCSIMVPVCGSDWFKNSAECLAACESVPDNHDYSILVPYEDSIQCRLYHVTSATVATEHCPHAAGVLKCVDQGAGGTP